MQVMPLWVDEIPFLDSTTDLYDPELNLRAGSLILRRLCETAGNLPDCLAQYNAGPRAREGDVADYVTRVIEGQ